MKTEYVCDRCGAANYGHISLIEIVKWLCIPLPFYASSNRPRGVSSPLDGHLRDTRQWFSLLVEREGQIANNKNIGVAREREIWRHFNPAESIRLRFGPFGKYSSERIRGDTAGPEHGFCCKTF